MTEIKDGVIKYKIGNFYQVKSLESDQYVDIEKWRKKLYQLNLIGEYPIEKVGFGNLSKKTESKNGFTQFIITGTQTGALPELSGEHYTKVTGYDFESNSLDVEGPIQASSESLTHAAIYEGNSDINCVFHVHHSKLWKNLLNSDLPKTPVHIEYGTLDMAKAVQAHCKKTPNVVSMGGHEDGVIFFGKSLDETGNFLLEIFSKFKG